MTTNLPATSRQLFLEPDEAQLAQWIEQEQHDHEYMTDPHALFCRRSGVLLGQFIPTIREGRDVYVTHFHDSILLHPVYGYDQTKLAQRLHAALYSAAELSWDVSDQHKERIQLLCSAILWKLECIKQERPTLPSWKIAAGSAHRILVLARWFWFVSSRRLSFPIYSVSLRNDNLDWRNIKLWIDAAFQVKTDWETKSRKAAQRQELIDAGETTQLILRQKLYKRLDLKKIWNWIELQIIDDYGSGRCATWKTLFLDGDLESHLWLADDVDDLSEAICDCCDIGNEVSFFISDRLKGIRACINEYRGGFTLISASKDSVDSETQTSQELSLIAGLDAQAEQLQEMPPKPEQSSYPTLGAFLKAQAQWNLLNKRFTLRGK